MKSFLIAVDPGARGGIATWHPMDAVPCVEKMPATPKDTHGILALALAGSPGRFKPDIKCYMEQVGGFIAGSALPGSAMFNFGQNYGRLEGFLIALGIPFELVAPSKWQASLGIPKTGIVRGNYTGLTASMRAQEKKRISKLNGKAKRDHKNVMKEIAQRYFPSIKVTLENADALLIMEYARRQQTETETKK